MTTSPPADLDVDPSAPLVENNGPYDGGQRIYRRTTYLAVTPRRSPLLGKVEDRLTVWSDSTHVEDETERASITIAIDEHGTAGRLVDPDDREPASASLVLNDLADMVAVRDALSAAIEVARTSTKEL